MSSKINYMELADLTTYIVIAGVVLGITLAILYYIIYNAVKNAIKDSKEKV